MGGAAFKVGHFPRLSAARYLAFKAQHTAALKTLFSLVATPPEAPEKTDFGDVDFIVWKASDLPSHDAVQSALGATMVIPQEGARTSHYAVTLPEQDSFYQVDVHCCLLEDEYHRTVFLHSYGDMGMIAGLIARGVGLHLGVHGLRYPQPPHPAWHLSSNFDEIFTFLGWNMSGFHEGFTTRAALYEWLGSSPYIRPFMFTSGNSVGKVKAERKMYWDFVQWAQTQPIPSASTESLREAALERFGVKEELESFLRQEAARARYKAGFNGKLVAQWADLGEDWRRVKLIMDHVRKECGGDEGIARLIEENARDAEKTLIEKVRVARLIVRSKDGVLSSEGVE